VRRATAVAVAAALALAPSAAAAECPRTSIADLEDEVMCPVCGTPLALATEAPQAQREREFIQRLINRCASKGQVKRALVAQFGEEVLALPGDEEEDDLSDVLVYLVPALALLLAAAGIAATALRWRRRRREPGPPSPQTTPAGGRLDADMERYDL
jgi:cytochrome c-type biogenesis protein CcmH/NrfF